jgi:hypothetical protein
MSEQAAKTHIDMHASRQAVPALNRGLCGALKITRTLSVRQEY